MYRAKDTFWAPDNRRIVKGDLVAPHDPVIEGREELFEEVVIPTAVGKPPAPAAKKTTAKPPAKKAAAKQPTPAAKEPGDTEAGDSAKESGKTEDEDGGDTQ